MLVAFGDQWLGAVGSMQALTMYALSVALSIPAGSVFKAVGRADVLLKGSEMLGSLWQPLVATAVMAAVLLGLRVFIGPLVDSAAGPGHRR